MNSYNTCDECTSCWYFNSDDDNCCPGSDEACFEYTPIPSWDITDTNVGTETQS